MLSQKTKGKELRETSTEKSNLVLPQRIREQLQAAPRLTLEEIYQKYDCDQETFPEVFEKQVVSPIKEVIRGMVKERNFSYDAIIAEELFDPLYQVWQATRELPPEYPLYELAQRLESFESFYESYFSGKPQDFQGPLITYFDMYLNFCHNPMEIRTVWIGPKEQRRTLGLRQYPPEKTWISLEENNRGNTTEVTTLEVLKQAHCLHEMELESEDLIFHSTGSSALAGIGEEEAILSASALLRRGGNLRSGEFVTLGQYNPTLNRPDSPGLADVYGSPGTVSSYGYSRWFDEYEVVFGLDREKVRRRLLEETGKEPFLRYSSEGACLGPRVPLDEATLLLTPNKHLPKLRAWAKEHAPEAVVTSTEAWKVAQRYNKEELERIKM